METTENILNAACQLYFVEIDQKSQSHRFGDVWVVQTNNNALHLKEHLIANNLGKTPTNFVDGKYIHSDRT